MSAADQATIAGFLAGRVPLDEARAAFARWAAWLDSTGRGVPHWIREVAA